MRVEKKDCNQRGVSTLFLELTCCDINEDFRLICCMHLKELRPVFFQHQKGRRAQSEHLDGYPEPLQTGTSSFMQFQNGMELCEL